MTIAMKRKKTRGRLPILELLFPKRIRETKCPTCGVPFLEHPDREPTQPFVSRDVQLYMYSKHSNSRTEYLVRVGVWRYLQDRFALCQLFTVQELSDLLVVVAKAIEFDKVVNEVNEKKGTAQKMSSSQSRSKQHMEDYGE